MFDFGLRPRLGLVCLNWCWPLTWTSASVYSNHQNSWQKFGGTKRAWLRCRPWRASARLRPSPCPARFVLPSFFVMNSEACYRSVLRVVPIPGGTDCGTSLKCAAGRGTGSFLKIYANLSIVRPPCSLYPFGRPAGGVIQVPSS